MRSEEFAARSRESLAEMMAEIDRAYDDYLAKNPSLVCALHVKYFAWRAKRRARRFIELQIKILKEMIP